MIKKLFIYRGRRIRLFHKNLLFKYGLTLFMPFFIGIVVYFYLVVYPLIQSLNGRYQFKPLISPLLITLMIIILGVTTIIFLIKSSIYRGGYFQRVRKKQWLAEYLDSNDFVIRQTKKTEKGTKEIRKFTKIYYKVNGDYDEFTFRLGNKFQDKFLKISGDLENMYLADLVDVKREPNYVTFQYLADTQSKRIKFEDLTAQNGRVVLMEGVIWIYDDLPHMLITGGTGGGKTYFIYSLIAALGKEGRVHIADPKNADLADLANFDSFNNLVVSDKKEIFSMLSEAVELMDKRYLYMKRQPNYTIGKNYRYYGMKPEFYIIDEWAAFVSVLGAKFNDEFSLENLYERLTPLVLKARQSGVFLILATQKAGTDVIRSSIRDNLMCKVSLGRLSDTGYVMTFGDDLKGKVFYNKSGVKGRGYIDVGLGVPNEFYAPLVDEKFDFVDYFKAMSAMPYTDISEIELNETSKKEVDELLNDDFVKQEQEMMKQNASLFKAEHEAERQRQRSELLNEVDYSEKIKQRQKQVG
ncbi:MULTISPECIES: FtsK/SpoIIIE domain-containing protein [unclassified Enterococcus]|uniref:FtsK/SpoIIIE domain-containing protein n=1 Tax=unclassified Enterococcus TaxID=2608891 RepID=UPI001556A847|nr:MULTISPECIES: FtsK/SpoIIIE domain-containing protein [unclassified Enterococcus]MBS7576963.1 cell division protein FtsK [Enterococcus sp. MMGLQ5-2]MBS7584370.1 cell division protein FtsK [Enterococcus sp. MMGLQ5-1]NPD12225.1 cell division protein FtsK [Enterococcus sp. MMGLQ5-1]NPD36797.1 cell division protein FtsK [Enterococcus sp. MMGLQ5-2]